MESDAEHLDLSHSFDLEPHGRDTFVGESPPYPWGRIYGGLVIAQALCAAAQTVRSEHGLHSLHAYFILGGNLSEPVRYEVDRVRNGRSFTTRRVVARQSSGAILTLGCSYQRAESGPITQSAEFPPDIPEPESLERHWDAGAERCDVPSPSSPPRSRAWVRMPRALEDARLGPCALAYLSDMNPMGAIHASYPKEGVDHDAMMGASLDHAMWFHRESCADDWVLVDMLGHGMIGTRGLATGMFFDRSGHHLATVAQEGLLRAPSKAQA